ncbi:MAG: ABC transporter substrate-binding protein, partial [Pseudomonadota bacterium]|nr:ABC transporter substrate-binding protein [Pseudomonadota bacterium]
MEKKNTLLSTSLLVSIFFCWVPSEAFAQTTLRISHQWPGGTGDVRDEMFRIIAREVEAAEVDLVVR